MSNEDRINSADEGTTKEGAKRRWESPTVEDLGVGATALGSVPFGTPDGIGNVKS